MAFRGGFKGFRLVFHPFSTVFDLFSTCFHGVLNDFSLASIKNIENERFCIGVFIRFHWCCHLTTPRRGDGCGFVVQKRMADWVDGRQVLIEGEPLAARLRGAGPVELYGYTMLYLGRSP